MKKFYINIKKLFFTICLLSLTISCFAQNLSSKNDVPGFFDVYIGDSRNKVIKTLQTKGFAIRSGFHKQNSQILFMPSKVMNLTEDLQNNDEYLQKFAISYGTIPISGIIVEFYNDTCCYIQMQTEFWNSEIIKMYETEANTFLNSFSERAFIEEGPIDDKKFHKFSLMNKYVYALMYNDNEGYLIISDPVEYTKLMNTEEKKQEPYEICCFEKPGYFLAERAGSYDIKITIGLNSNNKINFAVFYMFFEKISDEDIEAFLKKAYYYIYDNANWLSHDLAADVLNRWINEFLPEINYGNYSLKQTRYFEISDVRTYDNGSTEYYYILK